MTRPAQSTDNGRALRHVVVFEWDHGTESPQAYVRCPYKPDDPERPCRIYADYDETDEPKILMDGCGVVDNLDAGGYESIDVRGTTIRAEVEVDAWWDVDQFWVIGEQT